MFEQAVEIYMLEFEEALELAKKDLNNPELQIELNYKLGTVLHWIMAYWERVKKSNEELPEEKESFFYALGFANNQMKHEPTFTKFVKRIGGFSFPISFPLTIPAIQFIWHIDSNKNTRYKDQRTKFKKYLENKEVMETISEAIEILKEYELI